MKKILSFVLVALMMFSIVPMSVMAEDDTVASITVALVIGDEVGATFDDGETQAVITVYEGETITLPSVVNVPENLTFVGWGNKDGEVLLTADDSLTYEVVAKYTDSAIKLTAVFEEVEVEEPEEVPAEPVTPAYPSFDNWGSFAKKWMEFFVSYIPMPIAD